MSIHERYIHYFSNNLEEPIRSDLRLNKSLLHFRHLPLNDLWSSLLYVACKQTGRHRLKTIQLLLRILQSPPREGAESEDPLEEIDISLLRPLWQLYNKMSDQKSEASGTVIQPVVRAMTELFLVAEKRLGLVSATYTYLSNLEK